jgi:hypothetical protein
MRNNTLQVYKQIVFNILGNKCKFCNSEKRLCVHHKDRNSFNNKLDNLLLLCSKCHGHYHSLAGTLYVYELRNTAKKHRRKLIMKLKPFITKKRYLEYKESLEEKSK